MSEITFSTEQQLALLGHAITTPSVLEAMVAIGIPRTLFKATQQKVYGALEDFIKKYHRAPTLEELKSGDLRRDDSKIVESSMRVIEEATSKKDLIALPTIYDDVIRWYTGGLVVKDLTELANLWNKKEQDAVIQRIHDLSNKLNHISRTGMSAYMQTSDKWLDYSIEAQKNIKDKLLYTGITFIDDATCGIRPDDLLVFTSRTGIGKTTTLGNMARNMANMNKKVGFFALEAFSGELELRWRYQLVLQNFYSDEKRPHLGKIDFIDWLNGNYPELSRYEPTKAQLRDHLKNIVMLYKKTSNYTIRSLERDMMSMVNEVDVFIVDHLHYIDKDGRDENAALQEAVQKIRDINLSVNKPVILAAHVRKQMERRKDRSLLPELEDIHGSSDTSKVATWVFTMSQLVGVDNDKVPVVQLELGNRGRATLIKALKSRSGGSSRTGYAGIAFFTKGTYHNEYIIGELKNFETEWHPIEYAGRPVWTKHAVPMPKVVNNFLPAKPDNPKLLTPNN